MINNKSMKIASNRMIYSGRSRPKVTGNDEKRKNQKIRKKKEESSDDDDKPID